MPELKWLSVAEIALATHWSEDTIRRLVQSGDLPSLQLGGPNAAIRIPASVLDTWTIHEQVKESTRHGIETRRMRREFEDQVRTLEISISGLEKEVLWQAQQRRCLEEDHDRQSELIDQLLDTVERLVTRLASPSDS